MATTRPSPSMVAVGYQRALAMLGPADHLLVAGSNSCTALMPTSPPLWPPTTMRRPSGSCRWAEQKICVVVLGAGVNACVPGFQTVTDGVPPVSQASHSTTSPLSSSDECTATRGQLISGPHWPLTDGSETAAARLGPVIAARSEPRHRAAAPRADPASTQSLRRWARACRRRLAHCSTFVKRAVLLWRGEDDVHPVAGGVVAVRREAAAAVGVQPVGAVGAGGEAVEGPAVGRGAVEV